MGGGLAGLWVGDKPVLRPWTGDKRAGPFDLALNILAPFSNRIADGFDLDGQRIALTPNLPGERYPIHGDAFARAWTVDNRSKASLGLRLDAGSFGPWLYRADLAITLAPTGLRLSLRLQNLAKRSLPYGIGFHPWFPRDDNTQLCFRSQAVWQEAGDHLPKGRAPVPAPRDWQFGDLRALPSGWINNAFVGWDGKAVIRQGEDAVSARLTALAPLDCAIVYSPSARADFFCFEPVSHPPDAVNLPGQPGLVMLPPSSHLSASMSLTWAE